VTVSDTRLRRRARERAVQFLFGLEFTEYGWQSAIEAFWEANPARRAAVEYAERLIQGVVDHRAELDTSIESVLEQWSLRRLGRIERNVIRVALYEMRYCGVPAKVAINEAIELARAYGPDEAPAFVNGVLDRLKEN